MTVEVITSFKVKANGKEVIFHPGQRIKLRDGIAEQLILDGRVRKIDMPPVKIYSRLFNEEIWLVATKEEMEALVTKEVKEVIYVAWEIPVLKGMEKEKLMAIHSIKKIFPGAGLVC